MFYSVDQLSDNPKCFWGLVHSKFKIKSFPTSIVSKSYYTCTSNRNSLLLSLPPALAPLMYFDS